MGAAEDHLLGVFVVGSDEVESAVCGPAGVFTPARRAKFLKPLVDMIRDVDVADRAQPAEA